MAPMDDVRNRLAVLESRFVTHEKRHEEFMVRTDERLATLIDESSQWHGVRRTLAALVTILTIISAAAGWAFSQIFPHGLAPRS